MLPKFFVQPQFSPILVLSGKLFNKIKDFLKAKQQLNQLRVFQNYSIIKIKKKIRKLKPNF